MIRFWCLVGISSMFLRCLAISQLFNSNDALCMHAIHKSIHAMHTRRYCSLQLNHEEPTTSIIYWPHIHFSTINTSIFQNISQTLWLSTWSTTNNNIDIELLGEPIKGRKGNQFKTKTESKRLFLHRTPSQWVLFRMELTSLANQNVLIFISLSGSRDPTRRLIEPTFNWNKLRLNRFWMEINWNSQFEYLSLRIHFSNK